MLYKLTHSTFFNSIISLLVWKSVKSWMLACWWWHFDNSIARLIATMLADSYISASASSAGATAEMAASRKQAKYAALSGSYAFQPIALETLGPINESAVQFLNALGHKITSVSADDKRGTISLPTTLYRSADSMPSCCMSDDHQDL